MRGWRRNCGWPAPHSFLDNPLPGAYHLRNGGQRAFPYSHRNKSRFVNPLKPFAHLLLVGIVSVQLALGGSWHHCWGHASDCGAASVPVPQCCTGHVDNPFARRRAAAATCHPSPASLAVPSRSESDAPETLTIRAAAAQEAHADDCAVCRALAQSAAPSPACGALSVRFTVSAPAAETDSAPWVRTPRRQPSRAPPEISSCVC